MRDERGLDDGIVIATSSIHPGTESSKTLGSIIHGLNPYLKVESAASQCPGTELWVLQSDVSGVGTSGDISILKDIYIGRPWGEPLR